MGFCDVCEEERETTRTYSYSEDDVVVFSVDMCTECGDEILPKFFDAVGYGAEQESVEWPDTAERDYSSSPSLESASLTTD